MNELKKYIHDEENGLDYVLYGDVYLPMIELDDGDDRPIGKWGRMRRDFLEETNPLLFNHLVLTGKLHGYLADLDEQARVLHKVTMRQMMDAEDVDVDLRRSDCLEWVRRANSITSCADEIIRCELIYI